MVEPILGSAGKPDLIDEFGGHQVSNRRFNPKRSQQVQAKPRADDRCRAQRAFGFRIESIDARMKVWDCAPLGVIMQEAGGTFTDWNGTSTIYGGNSIATNGILFDQVMEIVRGK